jgi:HB1, ASXL, restriction endonuclease HTH domain
MNEGEPKIRTLLDACRFILEDLGEAQSSYWLASQVVEMRLWRASEAEIRRALSKDIEQHGESSLFVKVGEDEYALRSWTAG